MESLPTGPTQSWFIAVAIVLSPMLTFFIADVVGRIRRKRLHRQPGNAPARTHDDPGA
jgi:hypothetical protein